MAEAPTAYREAVHRLQESFRAVMHVSNRVQKKAPEQAKTDVSLQGLEAHIAHFILGEPPQCVLLGIAQFYMDFATSTMWFLESKDTDIFESKIKIQDLDKHFVTPPLAPGSVTDPLRQQEEFSRTSFFLADKNCHFLVRLPS